MNDSKLLWKAKVSSGTKLLGTPGGLLVSLPNYLYCYSLDTGSSLFWLAIARWSEHRLSLWGERPLLLQRPSFGNFEVSCLQTPSGSLVWRHELLDSEDSATLRGQYLLGTSPFGIKLFRLSSEWDPPQLETLWEDRTSAKVLEGFVSPDGGLVGARLARESLVWRVSDGELLWQGSYRLLQLERWGWLAKSLEGRGIELFDPAGYALKMFTDPQTGGYRLLSVSERFLLFVSQDASRCLFFDLQSQSERTIETGGEVVSAYLSPSALCLGGRSELWVLDEGLVMLWHFSRQKWQEAKLAPGAVSSLLPYRGRLFGLTEETLFCLG